MSKNQVVKQHKASKRESGQAILLLVTAMSIFLFGALGLAMDGAQLYAQLQMAQTAADAGAQAGALTMFTSSDPNLTASTNFPITCSAISTLSPCDYVHKNGFGTSPTDTVTIDSPGSSMPGVTMSRGTVALRVTVQRTINTTFLRFLSPATTTVHARGVAAIVDVLAPSPILITHPTMNGALTASGGPTLTVCGGTGRSIQVNSNNTGTGTGSGAVTMPSNTTVDLSHAGPLDAGDCSTGTGASFGTFGFPNAPTFNFLAGVGRYIQPSAPMPDPLADVNPPVETSQPVAPAPTALANGVSGCPAGATKACLLYSPGIYTNGIDVKNQTAIFKPGVYFIDSTKGFQNSANGDAYMATGFADDPTTGQGMLIYDTNSGPLSSGHVNTGGFSIGANGTAALAGAGCSAVTNSCNSNYYKGILAFEDRNAIAHTGANSHSFGGGGTMSLIGTIYTTPTDAAMRANPAVYSVTQLKGTSGSSTVISGDIITSSLDIRGNAGIKMRLNPLGAYVVRQVALVR